MKGHSINNVSGATITQAKHFYRLNQDRINKIITMHFRCYKCGRFIKINDNMFTRHSGHRYQYPKYYCELCALTLGFITQKDIDKLNSDINAFINNTDIETVQEHKNRLKRESYARRKAKL